MLYTLRFFSSKCSLFHNANLFDSCIIHILYTGCAEIKKKKKIRRQRVNITNFTMLDMPTRKGHKCDVTRKLCAGAIYRVKKNAYRGGNVRQIVCPSVT